MNRPGALLGAACALPQTQRRDDAMRDAKIENSFARHCRRSITAGMHLAGAAEVERSVAIIT